MDRGAWQTVVQWVTKSQIQLSDFHFLGGQGNQWGLSRPVLVGGIPERECQGWVLPDPGVQGRGGDGPVHLQFTLLIF